METRPQISPVIKKERVYDREEEQIFVGAFADSLKATLWPKKEPNSSSQAEVFVLSEIGQSDRAGLFCRPMKFQTKPVPLSDIADFKKEKSRIDLRAEKTNRVADERLTCTVCGEEQSCQAELRLHMKDHEQATAEVESPPYVCELCGAEYARKPNLKIHMRIHTGETPYECKICKRGFRRSDWLAQHMKLHEDDGQMDEGQRNSKKKKQRYPCDHCEKTYISRDALRIHVRKHLGEKPYPCSICDKWFHSSGCLKRHLECHSDDRPYQCSECGHTFKRLGTLNKHKRIHTGEKPYCCSNCGKKFRYKYGQTVHMRKCQSSDTCQRTKKSRIYRKLPEDGPRRGTRLTRLLQGYRCIQSYGSTNSGKNPSPV